MAEQHSFLFVTWEGGGNTPPVLGLAKRLIKRGHHVRILTEPCLKNAVKGIGAEFIPFVKHFNRSDRTVDIMKDWEIRPFKVPPTVENVMIRPAMDVAHETKLAIDNYHTDIVVADLMMLGSLIAAEAKGIKRVVLFHMAEYLPGPGRPPGGIGLSPATGYIGRLRDKALEIIFNKLFKKYLPRLNSVRQVYDLKPFQTVADIYHQADLRIIQTSKAFDLPISPSPDNVRYVGPILDDPDWAEATPKLQNENCSMPLVVVGLSSTFQNQRSVLNNIITALSDMPIRVLMTLGPVMSKETFTAPDNIQIVASFPHSQIFPHAKAVITHAGHGTVMRALANGLPIVCLPMGRDQIDNAARVAHLGAGLKLSPNAKPSKIRKAIQRILDEPKFTQESKRLQQCILTDASSDLGVNELERLTYN